MTVTLQDAIAAINAGDKARGRQLLAQLLQQEPENEAAWIWMSGTVEDTSQRRFCLEKALAINPANPTALAGLTRLGVQPPEPPAAPLARMDHGLGQSNLPPDEPTSDMPQTPAFLWPPTPEPVEEEPIEEAPLVEETFIGDIVAAMNKDESAAQPPQDTELSWLLQTDKPPVEPASAADDTLSDMFSDIEPASPGIETLAEPVEALPAEDLGPLELEGGHPADLEGRLELPEAETAAFTEVDTGDYETLTPASAPTPGQTWENPKGGSGRLIILTDKYLITCNPKKKAWPQIEAALTEGQVLRSQLGRQARTIPLAYITTVRAPAKIQQMEVIYQRDKDRRTQIVSMTGPEQRDEVFSALQNRLGDGFQVSIKKYNFFQAIAGPGLTLAIMALLTGLLYYGALQLQSDPTMLTGVVPAQVEQWLTDLLAATGSLGILIVGGGLILISLLWLIINLRQPSRTQVLQRQ